MSSDLPASLFEETLLDRKTRRLRRRIERFCSADSSPSQGGIEPDFKIRVGQTSFFVSKFILARHSEVLRNLFLEDPNCSEMRMTGDVAAVRAMIDYVTDCKRFCGLRLALKVSELAFQYQMKDVMNLCELIFIEEMRDSSADVMAILAQRMELRALAAKCDEILERAKEAEGREEPERSGEPQESEEPERNEEPEDEIINEIDEGGEPDVVVFEDVAPERKRVVEKNVDNIPPEHHQHNEDRMNYAKGSNSPFEAKQIAKQYKRRRVNNLRIRTDPRHLLLKLSKMCKVTLYSKNELPIMYEIVFGDGSPARLVEPNVGLIKQYETKLFRIFMSRDPPVEKDYVLIIYREFEDYPDFSTLQTDDNSMVTVLPISY